MTFSGNIRNSVNNNVFEEVKSRVDMHSIALQYGFTPNRNGFICCPFHAEKTPSLKLYNDSFYCFGCGCGGDAINFTAELFDMSQHDAAEKLSMDFGLNLNVGAARKKQTSKRKKKQTPERNINRTELLRYYQEWEKLAFRTFNNYFKLLQIWYKDFAPKSPDDEPYPLWVRACHELPLIEYYCLIFIQGTNEERKQFFITNRKEVDRIASEYRKYTGIQ